MMSVMRPLTSEVTLTWCTAARSPTAVSRLGITSDLASAMLTWVGGGLLLAKNCAIMWLRNALKPTRPPTSSASSSPTMMNQRTTRGGRAAGLPVIAVPEMCASVTIFMSCTFCGYRLTRVQRGRAVEMRSDCGAAESDAAENEFTELPFELGCLAIAEAGNGRQSGQRRRQHGVVREPEQIKRLVADRGGIAGRHRALERGGEYRADQVSDLD